MTVDWRKLLPSGTETVLGLDEVGYGALAGPLVISIVATPVDWTLPGLRDSKKLSPAKRKALDVAISGQVVLEGFMSAGDIDRRGAYEALRQLHESAIEEALRIFPNAAVIVDGSQKIRGAINLIKADNIIPAVMAASVHAKVFRDNWMSGDIHEKYPQYHFDENKGYGTSVHYSALEKYGICDEHRRTFLKFHDGQVVIPEKLMMIRAIEDKEEEIDGTYSDCGEGD